MMLKKEIKCGGIQQIEFGKVNLKLFKINKKINKNYLIFY